MFEVIISHLGFNPINYANLQYWCHDTLGEHGIDWSEEYLKGKHIFRFAKESDKMIFMLRWGIPNDSDN